MKKTLILLFALILLGPSLVFSDTVSFKLAYFAPRAESDLWEIEFENMDFTKNNFHNTSLSFSYEYFLNKQISFLVGIDTYSRKKSGIYKDYVGISFTEGEFAFPSDIYEGEYYINHVFDVSITPIQVSMKLAPMGRRMNLIPYIGGGAGVYLWTVRLQGDMVDFNDIWYYEDPDLNADVEIYGIYFADAREESKVTFGFHAFGGLMFLIGNRMSIDAEFKYNFVKGNLTEGFEGFESFDLSGYQISVGMSYWF